MENNARIIISRKPQWVNRIRRYKVFIDGALAGSVRNDSAEEFQVTPGPHTVSCKVNWCSSQNYEVNLNNGQVEHLEVKNGMKYYYIVVIPLLLLLLGDIYFDYGVAKKPGYYDILMLIVGLPALIYVLYYLTIGKHKYLVLGKDDAGIFAK